MTDRCAIHPDRAAETTCTRCGDFVCYECVGPIEASVCAKCRSRVGGPASRVRQVKVLGAVTIGHGVLISLVGLGYALVVGFAAFVPPAGDQPPPPAAFFFVMGGCFGATHLIPGILQIIAGVKLLSHRGRTLAIVAYASGILTVAGCYCMMTSMMLAVWGLVLLLDREVQAHFDRPEGATP